jgi:hypothetical protein
MPECTTIEEEIAAQIEHASNPVLLPDVRRLDELFERVEVLRDLHRYNSRDAKSWEVDDYRRGRRYRGRAVVSTFCSVRGTTFSLDVTPRAEVLALVERHMLLADGYVINFEVTIRSGGRTALVAAHYNKISGGRWFAIIDADQIRALEEPCADSLTS